MLREKTWICEAPHARRAVALTLAQAPRDRKEALDGGDVGEHGDQAERDDRRCFGPRARGAERGEQRREHDREDQVRGPLGAAHRAARRLDVVGFGLRGRVAHHDPAREGGEGEHDDGGRGAIDDREARDEGKLPS